MREPHLEWLILALLLLSFFVWTGAGLLSTLTARFDAAALEPPPSSDLSLRRPEPLDAAQQQAQAEIEAWCHAGIGDGRLPFWRPFSLPDVPVRFSLAALVGDDGGGKSHLAEALARRLDRSDELAALVAVSARKGLRLKLAVKWRELWWWRARQPSQPWDCGYLVEDPARIARLAHFRPRRPTLIIADKLSERSLTSALASFSAARAEFRHPVRLLVLDLAQPHVLALQSHPAMALWLRTPATGAGFSPD